MPERKNGRGRGGGEGQEPMHLPSEMELVVIARPDAGLRARADGVASVAGADVGQIAEVLETEQAQMRPLFGESEERLQAERSASPTMNDIPDLSLFYRVEAPERRLDDLARKLNQMATVEAAYVKPGAVPSRATLEPPEQAELEINEMKAMLEEAPPATPNFLARQVYLHPAPAGVDAGYAWGISGGTGRGVQVIDVEGAWRFSHEDLRASPGGVVGGTPTSDVGWRNHGTAVVGVITGDRNGIGIQGIAPDAHVNGVSIFGGLGSAGAIRAAANRLRPGDILLIELHRPGPRHNFQVVSGQNGFVALEWWPDDYAAIRYAVSKGIVVVEAAGNGAENLDDAIYNTNPAAPFGPFPSWWRNPFRRSPLDSGAILVGAGAPPPGTHGRNHGADRSRLGFSNYGSAVDVQGHGREVTTTGYGDLQGGANEDEWYTDRFSGTSSASPVVVGTLACVQGVLRARGRIPLDGGRARALLRSTGSPQQSEVGRPASQRIGNRPNLRQLIPLVLQQRSWLGVQFRGIIPATATRRWFTFNWPAHWHVHWTVVPTSPRPGGPQLRYHVEVERATDQRITYWINITNLTAEELHVEARYAVLGW